MVIRTFVIMLPITIKTRRPDEGLVRRPGLAVSFQSCHSSRMDGCCVIAPSPSKNHPRRAGAAPANLRRAVTFIFDAAGA